MWSAARDLHGREESSRPFPPETVMLCNCCRSELSPSTLPVSKPNIPGIGVPLEKVTVTRSPSMS
jgi:hypothetical protein